MASELAALDPKELVLVLIALVGLVPVLLLHTSRSKLFTGGYLLLCVGALATNVEALVLGDILNLVEHGAGIAASGIVFLLAARSQRAAAAADGE
ncbi:hypothetical protein ACFQJC_16775 [Haloferax namakaokahaiae]|uniref:DUF2198 family protein n=1 Tax=Haloferax namakaokahaiae TaxID=1748331 RepID=A0ABD5ZJ13_9EURY